MSNKNALTIGDLTPGNIVSGAKSYIKFNPSEMEITEYSVIESGVPIAVYHSREFDLGEIPTDISEEGLARLEAWLEGQASKFARISEGFHTAILLGKVRGYLTSEAREVLENLREEFLEFVSSLPTNWKARDYFSECRQQCLEEIIAADNIETWSENAVEDALLEGYGLGLDDVIEFGRELVEEHISYLQELLP